MLQTCSGRPLAWLSATASVALVVATSDSSEMGIGAPARTASRKRIELARWPLSGRRAPAVLFGAVRSRPSTAGSCPAVRSGPGRGVEYLLRVTGVAVGDVGDVRDRAVPEPQVGLQVAVAPPATA